VKHNWTPDDDLDYYDQCQESEFDHLRHELTHVVDDSTPASDRRINVIQCIAALLVVEVAFVVGVVVGVIAWRVIV
jgi:hypothetical protein